MLMLCWVPKKVLSDEKLLKKLTILHSVRLRHPERKFIMKRRWVDPTRNEEQDDNGKKEEGTWGVAGLPLLWRLLLERCCSHSTHACHSAMMIRVVLIIMVIFAMMLVHLLADDDTDAENGGTWPLHCWHPIQACCELVRQLIHSRREPNQNLRSPPWDRILLSITDSILLKLNRFFL